MNLKTLLTTLLILSFGCQQLVAQQTRCRRARVRQTRAAPREPLALRLEGAPDVRVRLLKAHVSVPEFLKLNTDGQTGYYLKQVGGPVLSAANENFAFYPASTIKVMQHLFVMNYVQTGSAGLALLSVPIQIWDDSCADKHKGETPKSTEPLIDALKLMMKNSDNARSNAIQETFGRPAINYMAHKEIGMSNSSALNHKFGCAGPNSKPANSLTLTDLGLLYEGIANGTLVSGSTREDFFYLMLNETDAFFIEPVIDQEASDLELSTKQTDMFKSKVKLIVKAGGIPATFDGFRYESEAGYVVLPFLGTCTGAGVAKVNHRGFVFGVFINKATQLNPGTTATSASELFREQIHAALETWKACPHLRQEPN